MPYLKFHSNTHHKISTRYTQRSSFLLSERQRISLILNYRLCAIIRDLCLVYPIHLHKMLKHMEYRLCKELSFTKMHIQTHMLDALQGCGHATLEISFMLYLESQSQDMYKNLSFFF